MLAAKAASIGPLAYSYFPITTDVLKRHKTSGNCVKTRLSHRNVTKREFLLIHWKILLYKEGKGIWNE